MTSPPSTTWQEQLAPDEDERFERLARKLRRLQHDRAAAGGAGRALHTKGHGYLGELRVLEDLAPPLRQGLFAEPRSYRCYVRFSNGAGTRQSDRAGDVRGIAIKVLGVPGRKVIPGLEDATTQDFLLIHSPSTPFRDAEEFVGVVVAARSPLLALPRLFGLLGVGRTFELLGKLRRSLGQPFRSVATARYYSALPLRYGAHAAKLTLVPRATDEPAGPLRDPQHLRMELQARLAGCPVEFDLCAQLYRDEATTPIEDPTTVWSEDAAPLERVATLAIPRHDSSSARARDIAARIETLSFDPWHALEAHRPLGSLMRARNVAYRHSTTERGAAPEPDGSELD
ncbi:MAG: catalase family protein [Myxococcales bacterium]|nr:catalase family protein [Myxococcales bacterium]